MAYDHLLRKYTQFQKGMIFYLVVYKGCETLKTATPLRDTTPSGQSSFQSELEIAPLIDFAFYKIVLS